MKSVKAITDEMPPTSSPPPQGGRDEIIERFMKLKEEPHRTKYRTYVLVWLALVILTGITASVAGFHLGGWTVLIALSIAGTKSGLVLSYFMHLRSERLAIFKVIIPLVLAVLLVFISLTFSDLAYR
jgi:cytochrome c oxidase subunit 4